MKTLKKRNLQISKFSIPLRSIAFVTAVNFAVTHGVWASGNPSDIFVSSERNFENSAVPAHRSKLSLFDSMDLPEDLGRIKSRYHGSGARSIIHIQDAHANEDAQRNIARIVDYFAEHHGLSLVAVEGAQGELYPRLFSFLKGGKARERIADWFLKQGRLSGAEHLAIVKRNDLGLYGIEDRDLYEKNRRAYLQALEFNSRDEKVLQELKKILWNISRFVFSDELRELYRRREDFRAREGAFAAYAEYLVRIARREHLALKPYTGIRRLLELFELEKQIDFERAEREMKDGTQRLNKNVLSYLKYKRLYQMLDASLVEELENLEQDVRDKLTRSQEEVTLGRLWHMQEILEKMFEFSLTARDADFYFRHRGVFQAKTFRDLLGPLIEKYRFSYGLPLGLEVIDQDLPKVEQFYALALERDQVLIEKTVERAESSTEKVVAVVAGGFHTPGIERFLREHDYSYVVIVPKMGASSSNGSEGQKLYEESLKQKPLAVEKVLLEAVMQPRDETMNDPRFQLQPQLITPERSEAFEILKRFQEGMREANVEKWIEGNSRQALTSFLLILTMIEKIFESLEASQEFSSEKKLREVIAGWRAIIGKEEGEALDSAEEEAYENLFKIFEAGEVVTTPAVRFFIFPAARDSGRQLVVARYGSPKGREDVQVRSYFGRGEPSEMITLSSQGETFRAGWVSSWRVEQVRTLGSREKAFRSELRSTQAPEPGSAANEKFRKEVVRELKAKIAGRMAEFEKTARYRLFSEERKNAVRDFVEFHLLEKAKAQYPSLGLRTSDMGQGFYIRYDLDVLDFLAYEIRFGALKGSIEISKLAAFAESLKGEGAAFEDNFLYHNILEEIQGDAARQIPPADDLKLREMRRQISEMPQEIRGLSFMPEVLKAIGAREKEIEVLETKKDERPLTVSLILDPQHWLTKEAPPLFEAVRNVVHLFPIPSEMTLDTIAGAGGDETLIPTPLGMIRDLEGYGQRELDRLASLLRKRRQESGGLALATGRSELRRDSEKTEGLLIDRATRLLEAVQQFKEVRTDYLKKGKKAAMAAMQTEIQRQEKFLEEEVDAFYRKVETDVSRPLDLQPFDSEQEIEDYLVRITAIAQESNGHEQKWNAQLKIFQEEIRIKMKHQPSPFNRLLMWDEEVLPLVLAAEGRLREKILRIARLFERAEEGIQRFIREMKNGEPEAESKESSVEDPDEKEARELLESQLQALPERIETLKNSDSPIGSSANADPSVFESEEFSQTFEGSSVSGAGLRVILSEAKDPKIEILRQKAPQDDISKLEMTEPAHHRSRSAMGTFFVSFFACAFISAGVALRQKGLDEEDSAALLQNRPPLQKIQKKSESEKTPQRPPEPSPLKTSLPEPPRPHPNPPQPERRLQQDARGPGDTFVSYEALRKDLSKWSVSWAAIDLIASRKIPVPLSEFKSYGEIPSGKTDLWQLHVKEIVDLSLKISKRFREEISIRSTPTPLDQTEPAGVWRRLLAAVLVVKLGESMTKEDKIKESLGSIKMPLLQLLERYSDYVATLNEGERFDFAEKAAQWILRERENHKEDILAGKDHRLILLALQGANTDYLKRLFSRFGIDPFQMQTLQMDRRAHSTRQVKQDYLQALRQASRDRKPVAVWQGIHGLPGYMAFSESPKNGEEVISLQEYAKALVEGQAGEPTLQFGHMSLWGFICFGEDFFMDLLKGAIRQEAGGKRIDSLPIVVTVASRHSELQYASTGIHPYGYWGKLMQALPAGSPLRLRKLFETDERANGGYRWNDKMTERQDPAIFVPVDSRRLEEYLGIPQKYRGDFVPFLQISRAEPSPLGLPFNSLTVARRSELRLAAAATAEIFQSYQSVLHALKGLKRASPEAWKFLIAPSLGLLRAGSRMMEEAGSGSLFKTELSSLPPLLNAALNFKNSLARSSIIGEAIDPLRNALLPLLQNLSFFHGKQAQNTSEVPTVSMQKKTRRSWFAHPLGFVVFLLMLFFPALHDFFHPRTSGPKDVSRPEPAKIFEKGALKQELTPEKTPKESAKELKEPVSFTVSERPKIPPVLEPSFAKTEKKPDLPDRKNLPGILFLGGDAKLVIDESKEKTEYQIWRRSGAEDSGVPQHRLIGTIQDPAGESPYRGLRGWSLDDVTYHLMRITNGDQEEFALWEIPKPAPGYQDTFPMRFLGQIKGEKLGRLPSRSELRQEEGGDKPEPSKLRGRGIRNLIQTAALAIAGGLSGVAAVATSHYLFFNRERDVPPAAKAETVEPEAAPGQGPRGQIPARPPLPPDEETRKLAEELRTLREQVKKLSEQAQKPVEEPKQQESIYPSPALLGKPGFVAPSYRAEEPVPDPAKAQEKFDFKVKDTKIRDPRNPEHLVDAQWSLLIHGRPAILLEGFPRPDTLKQIEHLQEWQKLAPLGLQNVAVLHGTEMEKKSLDSWKIHKRIDLPVIFDSHPAPRREKDLFRMYYVKDGKMNPIKEPPSWSQLFADLQKTPALNPNDPSIKKVWKGAKPLQLTGLTGDIYAHLLNELTADQLSWMLQNDPNRKQADAQFPSEVFKILHVRDFSPEDQRKVDFEEFNLIQEDLKNVLARLGQPIEDQDEGSLYVLDWYHYFFKPYFILYQVSGRGAQKFMRVLKEVIPFHLNVVYPSLGIKGDDDLLPYRAETAEFLLRHPRKSEIWRRLQASWTTYKTSQKLPPLSLPYVLGDAMEAVPEVAAVLKLAGRQDLEFMSRRLLSREFLLTTVRNKFFESGLLAKRRAAHNGVIFGAMPLPNGVRKSRIVEFFLGSFNGLDRENRRDHRGMGGLQRELRISLSRTQRGEAMAILKQAASELSAKTDLRYEDFEDVMKRLWDKDFISSFRRFTLLERAQIAGLIGTPFLEASSIWYYWCHVIAPEANPFDFSSTPPELFPVLPEPFPVFPGSFIYTFRNLYGASATGFAASQLASTSSLFGDLIRPTFPKMPFDVRLRYRPSSISVFDPENYFLLSYKEPRFVEARFTDFTTYAQLTYRVNLMRFSNEARLGDFNARFVTLAPFQGAEARITSALLVFYLQHSELWEDPNARSLAEILGTGKEISRLIQNFRALHDAKIYQGLLRPELGDFLVDDFLGRLLDGSLGEVIEQENQRGLALTGGAYIDHVQRSLREHLDALAFDQGQGLLLPWLYPEKWPLPHPANVTLFNETPFRRSGILTTATMAMFNSYLKVLLQDELASAYAEGIVKPDSKPEDIQKFFQLKIALREMASVFYYGDKDKLRSSNRPDRDRLTALAGDAYRRGIPQDRYNHLLATASHPDIKQEALALLKLLVGEEASADLLRDFRIWWAGQRKDGEDAKQWMELLKSVTGPELRKNFSKWDAAKRSLFLQLLKQIRRQGWDSLKDVPEIFSPFLKKPQPEIKQERPSAFKPQEILKLREALRAKDEVRFQITLQAMLRAIETAQESQRRVSQMA